MIRNILYSLFLHSAVILIVYLSFNLQTAKPPKQSKVVMSFVIKSDNAALSEAFLKKSQILPPKEPIKEPVKEPEKKEPEKKPEKKSEKKPEKKPEKKTPPKPEKKLDSKKIKPDPKPKPKEEKKEEVKKEPEKKESEKKEEEKKEEPEVKEKEPETPPEEVDPDQPTFTENTIEGLNLLVREKFNIQSQIARCYKRALDQTGVKNKIIVNAHIFVEEDGGIDVDDVIIKDSYKYEDPKEVEFRKAVDVVKQALTFCSPIRNLPEDKYDVWKEIDLQFDGE